MAKSKSNRSHNRLSKERSRQKAKTTAETQKDSASIVNPISIGLGVVGILIAIVYFWPDQGEKDAAANRNSKSETKQAKTNQAKFQRADATSERRARPEYALYRAPAYARPHSFNQETVLVWGGDHQLAKGLHKNAKISNLSREDYAGEESCRSCHSDNYAKWSNHAHRWMNVLADEASVKGDFSGNAKINYRGGLGEFYRDTANYMMKLSRNGTVREFKINRTLGSRIHQYYIGVLVDGPEPEGHEFRTTEHVLPFGYELTLKEWIPIVHAKGQQGPDSARDDPFEIPSQLPYDKSCSACHTTPPAGNLMLAMFKRFAAYTPRKLHFEGSNYVDQHHPGSVRLNLKSGERFTAQNLKHHINDLTNQAHELLTQKNAVNLGIACEACHLGAKAHAVNEQIMPPFYPSGPHVFASGESYQEIWGKTAANKNFICARCHSGARPQFAAGMATWNSTEYTDAMRGHCYHEQKAAPLGMKSLTCVSCHNPHETIGRRWTKTAKQDNESCIKCHEQFRDEQTIAKHSHHPIGSSGSDCMNCHMPKINEGMGDMVRTHTIFNPTNAAMMEANQPNACNMCHVEKNIDWTLGYLRQWYGFASKEKAGTLGSYSEATMARNYPQRDKSAALGWLSSPHSGTRMVGSDVLIKAKADWALKDVLLMLDDPYMEIRQFTVQRLRDYFQINTDDFGYKLYMTKQEREAPIRKMLEQYEK